MSSLESDSNVPVLNSGREMEPLKKSMSALGSYKHFNEFNRREENRGVRISEFLNSQGV